MARTLKCGQCGNYAPYSKSDGSPASYGDCIREALNKEYNDGIVHFDDFTFVSVRRDDHACTLFRKGRTPRIRKFIKEHPELYSVKRLT